MILPVLMSTVRLGSENINLLKVIKTINEIEGIERIRLSSVEPVLFTDEFVSEVSKMEKVCPHYHLSLQSGCDETLKRIEYQNDEEKTILLTKIRKVLYDASERKKYDIRHTESI